MKFYSAYNPSPTIPTPTGDGTEDKFELRIDKNGVKNLEKVGKTNLYEKIQAGLEQTLIYNILERFNAGDTAVLEKAKGQFGDFTQFPTNLAEAQQQVINAEIMFNELPVKVRKEFNESYTQFLASFSDGSYKEIFEKYLPKDAVKEVSKEEVIKPDAVKDLNTQIALKQQELANLQSQVKGETVNE